MGSYNNHSKAEMYVHNSKLGIETRWYATKDYPYYANINAFSILSHKNDFIIFGGNYQTVDDEEKFTSIITMFKTNKNSWSEMGNLQTKRHGHQSINANNNFLVVGGQHRKQTELCQLEKETINCTIQGEDFEDFVYYPVLVKILPSEECIIKYPQTLPISRKEYKKISDSLHLYMAQTSPPDYSSYEPEKNYYD